MPLLTAMERVKVLTKQDVRLDGQDVPAGTTVSIDKSLFNDWITLNLAEEVKGEQPPAENKSPEDNKPPTNDADDESLLKHIGGGYYQLPNGEKVRGKNEAIEAIKALKGGDGDGAQTGNSTDTGSSNPAGD